MLVAAGTIIWIGDDLAPLPATLDVAERDLGGHRLIPGLIDCHVHLTGGGGETGGARFRVPRVDLSHLTRGGTTTAVGLLGTDDITRTTADLIATARGLNEEGITAYCYTGRYHYPPIMLHLHMGDGPRGLSLVQKALERARFRRASTTRPTSTGAGLCSTRRCNSPSRAAPST